MFARCIAELAHLDVESRTLESFSLEHEDPTRVLGALHKLGHDSHANPNYSLGLRRAFGLERAAPEGITSMIREIEPIASCRSRTLGKLAALVPW